MRKERRYSYKDVDMLIAARTLCDNFENHKAEITAARAIWVDPFIGNFRSAGADMLSGPYINRNVSLFSITLCYQSLPNTTVILNITT